VQEEPVIKKNQPGQREELKMSDSLLNFTDDSFESQVLKNEKPVLVDFWATWCGPCKALTPTMEKLADEFEGKCVIGKMDIGTEAQTAGKFGVRSIPALLFFKGGEVVDSIVGNSGEDKIRETIKKVIG
jgi:thioredoxin